MSCFLRDFSGLLVFVIPASEQLGAYQQARGQKEISYSCSRHPGELAEQSTRMQVIQHPCLLAAAGQCNPGTDAKQDDEGDDRNDQKGLDSGRT